MKLRIINFTSVKYFQKFILLTIFLCSTSSFAINVSVVDQSGNPVVDAVVSVNVNEALPEINGEPEQRAAVMDQINTQFDPYVLPVQKGTYVNFPNSDNIRHHVYSFSKAKMFQIKLYSGMPSEPIFFDQTGIVALGCNIHDVMRGFIYILDTPYFSKTDANGMVQLNYESEVEYQIEVWHPDQEQIDVPLIATIDPKQNTASTMELAINLKLSDPFREPKSDLEKRFQILRNRQ